MGGPLSGFRVVELSGLGPVAFAGMLLADLGAEVIRVGRCDEVGVEPRNRMQAAQLGLDELGRSRRRIAVDLGRPDGVAVVLRLCEVSDVLLEGFRPGVVARLGLGPAEVAARNRRLVYTHVTGWGQDGPLASAAGHEINFLALSGGLDAMAAGGEVAPPPPGYVADFPGAMAAVIGVLAALVERAGSGRGDQVDAAVLDTALLTGVLDRFLHLPHPERRGSTALDGGSHFYRSYRTADGRWISFGAVEPAFHAQMLQGLGIPPDSVRQHDRSAWPELRERIAAVVATRTRAEWDQVFAGRDACYSPVLSHEESAAHPHVRGRDTTAPRFERARLDVPRPAPPPGTHTRAVLEMLGYADDQIRRLLDAAVVRQAD
jgi:alpha-methylacyl-CoA racemase